MKKIAILAMTAAMTLAACATGPTHTMQDANSAITAAEHELSRAKNVNYAWRDTGKMIKKAKEEAEKGEFDKAVKTADAAKTQSTLALQQYEDNKNVTPRD